MSYHYKDIYRILIPGIIMYFVLEGMFPCAMKEMKSTIGFDSNNFNVFYVFFIPIVGFLLGFVNNFLSALIEKKVSYGKLYRRPSFRLLNNNNKFIQPINSTIFKILCSKLLDKEMKYEAKDGDQSVSEIQSNLTNEKAYSYFSKANQNIKDRTGIIEANFNYMVFARNIRLPMLLLFIEVFIRVVNESEMSVLLGLIIIVAASLVLLVLPWCMWQWYSLQHTKYIFIEYAKEV